MDGIQFVNFQTINWITKDLTTKLYFLNIFYITFAVQLNHLLIVFIKIIYFI